MEKKFISLEVSSLINKIVVEEDREYVLYNSFRELVFSVVKFNGIKGLSIIELLKRFSAFNLELKKLDRRFLLSSGKLEGREVIIRYSGYFEELLDLVDSQEAKDRIRKSVNLVNTGIAIEEMFRGLKVKKK